ncbi:unnamed protein product [Leptosia nina]|uniref:Uncharacterized protein n=1 Tax=Leptosia nina TaxID=320188 RepID=A0AAV1JWI0_9NEOP
MSSIARTPPPKRLSQPLTETSTRHPSRQNSGFGQQATKQAKPKKKSPQGSGAETSGAVLPLSPSTPKVTGQAGTNKPHKPCAKSSEPAKTKPRMEKKVASQARTSKKGGKTEEGKAEKEKTQKKKKEKEDRIKEKEKDTGKLTGDLMKELREQRKIIEKEFKELKKELPKMTAMIEEYRKGRGNNEKGS